jgi:hypothetical protein
MLAFTFLAFIKSLAPFMDTFAGFMMGYYFPKIVEAIRKRRQFTADRAKYIAKHALQVEIKETRDSEVFKTRMSEILKTIKEKSYKNETELGVTHLETCKTDQQIRKALGERGFSIGSVYDNGMTIRW